ncbi:hypothetical protein Glove_181g42 [Diversispora epigaea]|uniref:Uncharacterized protein n=1 Tax=Diversispora epigaea TaxID=1348612 RepID=A0A397ISN5_9GLOM|nr:hypothetical protein Glove_181g42 [Diversispora epigaea]
MSQIHTLSDIGEGKKLGDMPTNRYPSSRTELENQLVCANQDREIAIECGNRLANKCSILDKENKRIQHNLKQFNKDKEKLSKHAFQLIDEVKRLKVNNTNLTSQIIQSQISRDKYKARYDIQLKEIRYWRENLSKTESENLSLKSKMDINKMSQIHTLSDIGEGKKLGDMPTNRYPSSRTELENQLVCANQDREIAIECGNRLANKCSILDKENKRIQHNLKQFNKDKEKLSKHAFQLIDEVKRLKILEGKLASAQKDAFSIQENLSKTESENLSLKSKMGEFKQIEVELERVRSKLNHLKSEDISKPVDSLTCSTIVGGDDEKNIVNESSNSLKPYLARKKNIEDIEKINNDDRDIPKVSDSWNKVANVSETNNSETSKDIMLDTYINSDPQISVGGIEEMRPSLKASSLVSLLSAYMLLILIIAVIWFVVFRREWDIGKKSEQLRNM